MANDVRDPEIRDLLHGLAEQAPTQRQIPSSVLDRARRRIRWTALALGVGLLVVVAGASFGLRAMQGLGRERPAGVGPSPDPITTTIPIGGQPSGLATGEDAVWVADGAGGTVSRIDPTTDQVTAITRVGGRREDLELAAGDGAVWVTDDAHQISRIDPSTGTVLATIQVASPIHPAVGLGAVWVSDYDAGSVSRIDPGSNDVAATIPVPGSDPHGIAVLDGAVWVAIDDTGQVVKIDPSTNQVVAAFHTGSYGDLVAGFGSLWGPGRGGSLVRIDPSTGSTVAIDVGGADHYQPELAADDEGIWVVASRPNGTHLVRIDPATNTVDRSTEVDGAYVVETGFGAVWVVDASTGALLHVDPSLVPAAAPGTFSSPSSSPASATGPSSSGGDILPHADSTTIAAGSSFDFDTGTSGSSADVSWDSGRLSPVGGAWLASVTDEVGTFGDRVGSYDRMGPGDLRTYRFMQVPLTEQQVAVGDVFAVFTDQGKYVKAKVLSVSPTSLEIAWAAYPHGGAQPCWFSGVGSSATTDANGAPVVAASDDLSLCGTFSLDFDSGTTSDTSPDIWWEQMTDVDRRISTTGGADGLINLGPVDFDALAVADLKTLDLTGRSIDGNDDGTNQLVEGDVFVVRTSDGNFAKVEVVHYGYDLQLRFVTYAA